MSSSYRPSFASSFAPGADNVRESVYASRSFLYPGQSSRPTQALTKRTHKPKERHLDFGFSNGAKFISCVWFTCIGVLLYVVVKVMEEAYLPKSDIINPVCITLPCAQVAVRVHNNLMEQFKCNPTFSLAACGQSLYRANKRSASRDYNSRSRHRTTLDMKMAELWNLNASNAYEKELLSTMPYMYLAPQLIQQCVQASGNDFVLTHQIEKLVSNVDSVMNSSKDVTASLSAASELFIYPLLKFRLDYVLRNTSDVFRHALTDRMSVDEVEVVLAPSDIKSISPEDEQKLKKFEQKYGSNGACTAANITNVTETLLSFMSARNSRGFGHYLQGDYYRIKNVTTSQLSFSDEELAKFKTFVDVVRLKKAMGIDRQSCNSPGVQYVSDKHFFLQAMTFFNSTPGGEDLAKCFVGWVCFRTLLASMPALENNNQTFYTEISGARMGVSSAEQKKQSDNSVSNCWYLNRHLLFAKDSPYAAGLVTLYLYSFEDLENQNLVQDLEVLTGKLLNKAARKLIQANQDPSFLRYLGFAFPGDSRTYQSFRNFSSLVQTQMKGFWFKIRPDTADQLAETIVKIRLICSVAQAVWLNNRQLQFLKTNVVGSTYVQRLILELPEFFSHFMSHEPRSNPTRDQIGDRITELTYNINEHTLELTFSNYFDIWFIGISQFSVLAATFGQSLSKAIYGLSLTANITSFHGFDDFSFDEFLDPCYDKVEDELQSLCDRYNVTFNATIFRYVLFNYLSLSSMQLDYVFGHLLPVMTLEGWTSSQLFHLIWFQQFCGATDQDATGPLDEAVFFTPFTTLNPAFLGAFINCSYIGSYDKFRNNMCELM